MAVSPMMPLDVPGLKTFVKTQTAMIKDHQAELEWTKTECEESSSFLKNATSRSLKDLLILFRNDAKQNIRWLTDEIAFHTKQLKTANVAIEKLKRKA